MCDERDSQLSNGWLKKVGVPGFYFDGQLEVTQGAMEVIEGADNALVIMETRLRYPDGQGGLVDETRRATYVFRKGTDGEWRCTIDNSYGTALLEAQRPGDQPATD